MTIQINPEKLAELDNITLDRLITDPRKELDRCLRELDAKNYYNGGQTVCDRHPIGSESRARIIAEAAFWRSMIPNTEGRSDHE